MQIDIKRLKRSELYSEELGIYRELRPFWEKANPEPLEIFQDFFST